MDIKKSEEVLEVMECLSAFAKARLKNKNFKNGSYKIITNNFSSSMEPSD
jgi:hypothetical protein